VSSDAGSVTANSQPRSAPALRDSIRPSCSSTSVRNGEADAQARTLGRAAPEQIENVR